MKQKKLIFNFFVNRNWKKLTDGRKRAKILAGNRKGHHPIETLFGCFSSALVSPYLLKFDIENWKNYSPFPHRPTCLPHKISHDHCLRFLLGRLQSETIPQYTSPLICTSIIFRDSGIVMWQSLLFSQLIKNILSNRCGIAQTIWLCKIKVNYDLCENGELKFYF